jgi:hypothetical protein
MKDLNIDRGKAIGIMKQVLFDLINFFLGEKEKVSDYKRLCHRALTLQPEVSL